MPQRPRYLPGAATARGFRVRVDGPIPSRDLEIEPSDGLAQTLPQAAEPEDPASPWIVDVSGVTPDQVYELDPDNAVDRPRVRTPPASLGDDRTLNLALVSCYFPANEFEGYPLRALQCLQARDRDGLRMPHVKFMCGDQIYADVPASIGVAPKDLYRGRYQRVFNADSNGKSLRRLLEYGANVFTCDDHEFWNSYPEFAPHLLRSWGGSWQEWARAGQKSFWEHQAAWNFAPGVGPPGGSARKQAWCTWSAAGVDFFVADVRGERTSIDGRRDPLALDAPSNRVGFMSSEQREELVKWCRAVQRLGILVVGQPILSAQGNSLENTLPNYPADYTAVLKALREAVVEHGVSIVILSGDIHWGRLIQWTPPTSPRPEARLVEFVASAVGRVSVQSFFGEWFPTIGGRADTTLHGLVVPTDAAKTLRHFVPSLEFASNEHNVGTIEIAALDDVRTATFELWNLEQRAPALNDWQTPRRSHCAMTLPL